jgi:predicted nuclease of predicted toxin-antitoxin system
MKILIDECVPRPIIKLLAAYEAKTVQDAGWGAYKNGVLLNLAESEFDLFITSDQSILYQQNLAGRQIAILVLSTNHWGIIQDNAIRIVAAVQAIQPTDFVELQLPYAN